MCLFLSLSAEKTKKTGTFCERLESNSEEKKEKVSLKSHKHGSQGWQRRKCDDNRDIGVKIV